MKFSHVIKSIQTLYPQLLKIYIVAGAVLSLLDYFVIVDVAGYFISISALLILSVVPIYTTALFLADNPSLMFFTGEVPEEFVRWSPLELDFVGMELDTGTAKAHVVEYLSQEKAVFFFKTKGQTALPRNLQPFLRTSLGIVCIVGSGSRYGTVVHVDYLSNAQRNVTTTVAASFEEFIELYKSQRVSPQRPAA